MCIFVIYIPIFDLRLFNQNIDYRRKFNRVFVFIPE